MKLTIKLNVALFFALLHGYARFRRFEKAFLLAVDIGAKDLFMVSQLLIKITLITTCILLVSTISCLFLCCEVFHF